MENKDVVKINYIQLYTQKICTTLLNTLYFYQGKSFREFIVEERVDLSASRKFRRVHLLTVTFELNFYQLSEFANSSTKANINSNYVCLLARLLFF